MWPLRRLRGGKPPRSDSARIAASRRPAFEVTLRRARARRRLGGAARVASPLAERALREPRPAARGAPALAPQAMPEPEHFIRFDRHQRLQHIVMLATFTILVISGFPQKFPDVGASRWWVELLGGIENVRTIHHWSAYVMLVDCVYHVLYLAFRLGVQGRLDVLRMIPTPKDFEDAAGMFLYYLGAKEDRPRFDRYTYLEKFDYWAVFWGIVMIGASGLILMFPVTATRFLPGQILPTAHTIHSDEAMLAAGWIFIAHIFYVHLSPRSFPINTSIFTGRLRRRHYQEEHVLEYERLVERRRRAVVGAAHDGEAGTTAVAGSVRDRDTS